MPIILLTANPNIIIADEPIGNLDEATEKEILKIFSSLAHDDGKSVIIVTHSKEVTLIADVILGMNNGKIVPVKRK